MKIKKGDKVIVVAGKNKGTITSVIKTYSKENKLTLENVNLRTKFRKKGNGKPGEAVQIEGKIDASNVMILDPKTNKPSRIGYKILEDNKKVRIIKKSNEVIE